MHSDYRHLKETVAPGVFAQWQEVDAEICAFTDLGMKVAINDQYTGLVYHDQIYEDYEAGQKLKAYIKCVREDGRIDVSLRPNRGLHVQSTTARILEHLKAAGGSSPFNDKSAPEAIEDEFQTSKKVFKQALGRLYKQGKIEMSDTGIRLSD